MKLFLNGEINVYYIQTLCMIFFPGAKFGAEEQNSPDAPELYLDLEPFEEGLRARVTVNANGESASCEKYYPFTEQYTKEKTAKLVCGAAVLTEPEASGQALFREACAILRDEQRRQAMETAMTSIGIRDATERICRVLQEICQ